MVGADGVVTDVPAICQFIGADSLGYLSLEGMLASIGLDPNRPAPPAGPANIQPSSPTETPHSLDLRESLKLVAYDQLIVQ